MTFEAVQFWEQRYARGGTSGAGSAGSEAQAKVGIVQTVIEELGARTVLDVGCGDGVVASWIKCPDYVGLDPSLKALDMCRALMPTRSFVAELPDPREPTYDLALSLDVIFHLVDDADYEQHLTTLLGWTRDAVLIYGTNHDQRGAPHVRHRAWTGDIPPGWTVEKRDVDVADPRKAAWLIRWERPRRAEDVRGLIPLSTGEHLEAWARGVPDGQRIVEIGAYTGRSTAFLARAVREGGAGGAPVYSVDPHGLSGCERGRGGRFAGDYVRETYLRNLRDTALLEHVEPVRALSVDAPLPREPIGLLFIDGDHHTHAVQEDVRRWAPLIAPGGRIVFDDFGTYHPGVDAEVTKQRLSTRWRDWSFQPKPLATAVRT